MAFYEYRALDSQQKKTKGLIEADSQRQASQQLKNQGLMPLEIMQAKSRKRAKDKTASPIQLSTKEQSLLLKQLATLTQAGLPLDEVLKTLTRHTENPKTRKKIALLNESISQGNSLSSSVQKLNFFPPYVSASIQSAEASGQLAPIMARLAEEAERRDQLRKKVTTAMVYPSVILLVSLGVLVALMTGVVPQLVSLFEGMKQELPPLTLAVIAISDAFQTQGLLWLALLIALGFGWVRLGRIEKVKAWQERFLLHLPLFGKILKHQAASQLLRTLGMLHQSGTPMVDALDITAKVLDYSLHKKAIREARNRVQEGQSLFRAMEKQQLMSSMSLYMLASGEKSSRLSEMLFEAAKQEEDQLQNHITQLMALVEPVMILVMGGLVFVILMAVMLPIFELNQAVG